MTRKSRSFWSRLTQAMKAQAVKTDAPQRLQPASAVRPLALEQRFMFDGAAAVDVAHAAADSAAPAAAEHTADAASALRHALTAEAQRMTEGSSGAPQRQEVVFVDNRVQDYQQLIRGLKPGTEVVVLDSSKDGLQQIAGYLDGRSGIDVVHVLSHGDTGKVQLGNLWLDSQNLASHSQALASLGKALNADGDILLYGCEIGADGAGRDFIESLAKSTGADVAASTNLTGAQSRGGDWVLETSTGSIEAALPFALADVSDYDGVLGAPVSGTTDFGSDGNYKALANGVGNQGVTAQNVSNSGWDVTVTTMTNTPIRIEAGDLAWGTGDGIYYIDSATDGEPLQSFKVASNSGSIFDLKSVDVTLSSPLPTDQGQTTLTVTGYRNGVAVSGASQSFNIPIFLGQSNLETLNLSGNSNFVGVDSFVITRSSGLDVVYLGIDNINVASVRAPTLAPSMSATGVNPTFTENGTAVTLFSGVNADTHDSGQSFTGAQFTVSNVAGSSEYLTIHGVNVALSNGNSISLGSGYGTASISVSGGVATITLSGATLSNADMSSLLSGMTYGNSSDNPGSAARTVTLTQLTDSGASNNTVAPNISSVVAVVPVNDAPTEITLSSTAFGQSAGNNATVATLSATDVDSSTFTYSLVSGTGSTDNASFTLVGSTLRANNPSGMPAGLHSIRLRVTDDGGASYEKIVTLTVADDIAPTFDQAPTISNATAGGFTISGSVTEASTFYYVVVPDGASAPTATQVINGQNASGSFASAYGHQSLNSSPYDFSLALSGLAASTMYDVYVVAKDSAGNSTSSVIKLDVTTAAANNAPTTTVASVSFSDDTGAAGDFITNTASQTISGTLSAALATGETVQVSLDNGASWTNATIAVGQTNWSLSGQTLTGSNTLQARVTNSGGSSSAYTHTYTIDTTAPATPAAPTLAAASDTGSSSSDGITNVTTPTLTGTVEAGSIVTLFDTDGVTVLGVSTANGNGNWSITSSPLAQGSHSLSVIATDTAGNRSTASAKLNVTIDSNAPTGMVLSTNSVATSEASAGATVATLSASDSSSVTYQLVAGNGLIDADNAAFTLVGNSLQVNGAALSAGTYHIYLRAIDTAGNATFLATTVTVQDPPTVSSIVRAGGAAASVWNSATQVQYTVTFSDAVTGVDSSDFALTVTGTASGSITSIAGSGTTYTVTVSGISGDGSLRLDLKSSGTGIQGTSGNIAIAGGYTSGQTFTLDRTAPATPSAPTLAAASDTGSSSSDGITNVTRPTLTGTAEAGSTVNIYDHGVLIGTTVVMGGNWSFTPLISLLAGTHSFAVIATDAAGNVSAPSAALQVTIDTSAPIVASVGVPAASTYHSGETLTFTVNFSEAVFVETGGGTPRIAMQIGSTIRYATYVSGSGSHMLQFSYTVASGDADTDGITVGALSANGGTLLDAAGNNATLTLNSMGSTANVLVDGTQASVTSVSASTFNGSYGPGSTITVTVDFSRAVDVDTISGVPTLILSSGGTATYSGGSGTSTLTFTYTVGAGQNSADLDYASINALALNGAVITDAVDGRNASLALAAPGSAGSLGANKNIVIDTVAPTTTAASVAFSADTGSSSTDLITNTTAQTISGTLTANLASGESVQVSLDNGFTWASASASPGSPNWSLAGQTLNASDTLKVRVVDAAGNVGTAASFSYVLDTSVPTVVITSSVAALKAGESATFTFTFSEVPSEFTLGDLTATNGTLSNFTATSNPLVYTVDFTPMAGLTGSSGAVSLAAGTYTDTAGNAGGAGISTPIAIDTVAPVAFISSSASSLKAGETALITFTFSEVPQGFDLTDVTVMGGTLSGFAVTANPLVYTALFTPAANVNSGLAEVSINAGSYTDAAGNLGQGTSSATIHYDTGVPTTTVESVQFSSDTGASASDLITNISAQTISGTLSTNLASGESVQVSLDSGATWVAATVVGSDWALSGQTLSGSGVLQVRVADGAGNTGAVYAAAYTLDQSLPTVVISSDVATVNAVTPALITFTFSEAPVGFSAAAISVAGGTLGALTATSDPKVFTATFTPNSGVANGSAVISVNTGSYTDAAGNAGTAGMLSSLQIDTVAPTATPGGIHFSNDSGVQGDFITNVGAQTISGSLSAPLAQGDKVLISLDGGANWTSASVSGSSWSASASLLPGSNTLQVKVSDAAGNEGAVLSQAYVLDTMAPNVNHVGLPANGVYGVGQNLDFTVNFSEAVTVDSTGGAPRLAVTLDTGGTVYADYLSGSGGSALVFRLTVASGQLDTDGIQVAGNVQLNGGSIRDVAGNDSTTGFIAPSTSGILVDGLVPTVADVIVPANGGYKAGDVLSFTVNASEAVFTSGSPRLAVDIGGTTRYATFVAGSSGGSTLVFQYTVQAGDNDADGISVASSLDLNGGSVKDAAGNDLNLTLNSVGSTAEVVVDTVAPSVTSIVRAGGSPSNSGSVSYTVTFSEDVSGVDASDFDVTFGGTVTGTLASVTQVNGHTYTVVIDNLSGAGNVTLSLNGSGTGIVDAVDNAVTGGLTGETYAIDRVAPAMTSVNVPANGSYIAGQNLDFTVNFSESVIVDTSGGTPRIAVTLDTGGTVYAQYLSGSGGSALVFRLVVASGQLDTNGITLGSSIQANGGTLRDTVGNNIITGLNSVASTTGVLVDAVVPTVRNVSVPAGAAYNAGDTLTFVVNTSEAVVVNGVPRLALDIGGNTVFANLVSGSGTSTLVFQYTVQTGDNDADGISVSSMSANGATLRDVAGNDMNLTLNNVGSTSSVIVDTVAPTPSAIVTLDPSPSNAGSVHYTVTFSEGVSGVDLNDFTLVGTGTAVGSLSVLQQIDARTYQITVSGVSGTGTLGLNLNGSGTGILDVAGNPLNAGLSGASYSIDRVAPTITSVTVPANGTYVAGQNLDFTVTLDEDVLLSSNGLPPSIEVNLGNGQTALALFQGQTDSRTLAFRLTIQQGQLDTDGITLGSSINLNGALLRDTVGNDANVTLNNVGATSGIKVDAVVPVVSSVVLPTDGSYKAGDVLSFSVNASEGLQVTGSPRLALDVGGTTRYATLVPGGSSSTLVFQYIVQAGDNDANGISISASLDLNGGSVHDAAGNNLVLTLNGLGATSGVIVDTLRPTATIVVADTSLAVGETSLVTITFSEAVDGFDNSDLSVNGGTLSAVSSSDGGVTWTATFTPTVNLESTGNLITLNNAGVTDKAGNAGVGTTDSNNYAIDTLRPTVTIVVADNALKVGESSIVTITFSEAVTGLELSDFTVENGVLSDLTTSDGGLTWTATLTPRAGITDASNVITLNNTGYVDAADNSGTGTAASNGYAIDTLDPVAPEITLDQATLVNGRQVSPTGLVFISGLEAGGRWQYSLDNGVSWIEGRGNSLQLPGLGAFSLWVQQRDVAGNVSSVTSLSGVVEPLVPPAVPVPFAYAVSSPSDGLGLAPFQLSEVPEPNAGFLHPASMMLGSVSRDAGMPRQDGWSEYGLPQSIAGVNDWMWASLFAPAEPNRSGFDPAPEQFSVTSGGSTLDLKPVLLASESPWDIESLQFSFSGKEELPGWVRLDRHSGQLTINAPKDLSTTLVLQIKVSDGKGHESVRTVKLIVGDAQATSSVPTGRAGLSEKMANAANQQTGKRMSMYVHG
ncbi:Ig-like domain-containing protein [Comamonas thiooxydans]|uniref:Ig-like domain-containing protein n=1 Tax=Comamonas thiooxydans TaxID=363952 RepID=UPI003D08E292